jgi:hypothetical protein
MKKLLVTAAFLLATTGYAGQKAITDTGEQVILNSDGTWGYADNKQKQAHKIETNKMKFEKAEDSTFLLKSTKNNSAFWINPVKWSVKNPEKISAREYQFQLNGKDLYGMALTEEIEIPVESLVEIALANARNAAPDARIVMKEYRVVNGRKVLYMEINGKIMGIDFTYFGYYYSNQSGTTQFITYTATKTVDKYKSEAIEFLNGLVTQ